MTVEVCLLYYLPLQIEKAKEEADKSEEDLLKAATEGSIAGTVSEAPTTQPTEGMDSMATLPGDAQVWTSLHFF